MTENEFISQLREHVLDENMDCYRELFGTTNLDEVSDPHWLAALDLVQRMSDADKNVLLRIVRQTIVDTLSSMLAVLDGVSSWPGQNDDFILRLGESGNPINGGLMDLFLAAEEEGETRS